MHAARFQFMEQNLWLHFGVDEHPFATYFDVYQGYRVLTHSQVVGEVSKRRQPSCPVDSALLSLFFWWEGFTFQLNQPQNDADSHGHRAFFPGI